MNTLYECLALAYLSLGSSSVGTTLNDGVAGAIEYGVTIGINHSEGVVVTPEGEVRDVVVEYVTTECKIVVLDAHLCKQRSSQVGL